MKKITIERTSGLAFGRDPISLEAANRPHSRSGSPVPATHAFEGFTPDHTAHNEELAKAAVAGRVAIEGIDRRGYAMPIDAQLAAAEAATTEVRGSKLFQRTRDLNPDTSKLTSSPYGPGISALRGATDGDWSTSRAHGYLSDFRRTLDGAFPDASPEPYPVYPGTNYPVTGWSGTPVKHSISLPEAVDAGLLSPYTSLAFHDGSAVLGAGEDYSVEGWTPAARQRAHDLLAMQGGFGFPDKLTKPPEPLSENIEWDTGRPHGDEPQQEQPRQGDQI
jgi:hypothetical protein